MDKKTARLRRAKKTRSHIRRMGMPRLTVHRSGRHIYAQVISAEGGSVIAAASTLQKDLRTDLTSTSNKDAAKALSR
jgi:large subunit ribosomal protein L18